MKPTPVSCAQTELTNHEQYTHQAFIKRTCM